VLELVALAAYPKGRLLHFLDRRGLLYVTCIALAERDCHGHYGKSNEEAEYYVELRCLKYLKHLTN